MILAGNQSKQRGPLHINLKNQDGLCQRQICVILHDRHTDITCASATYTIRRLKIYHAEEISWKISGLLNLRKPLYHRKETLTFETQFDHVKVIPFI